MAFLSIKFSPFIGFKKNFSVKSSLNNTTNKISKQKFAMKNSQPSLVSDKKVREFFSVFLSFCILGSPLIAFASLNEKPLTKVVDESGSLTNSSVSYIEKSLSKLKETTGGEVYFVSVRNLPFEQTPKDYAQELFQKWNLGEKDIVVVLGNKIAKAGIYYGNQVTTLSEATVKSIGEETYPFNAREEQYGSAAIDVNNRLVSILSNKGDPGPPAVNRNGNSSNFKSAKKTEEQRSKYIAIIVILLVIAFVVPMVQFFWYVKDE